MALKRWYSAGSNLDKFVSITRTTMAEKIEKHVLANGMVILGQPMGEVESVAFDFMLPAGAASMPQGCGGASNIIADWIFRGAGDMDSRALSDRLDGLGLHRSSGVSSSHLMVGSVLEASNLAEALQLYAEVLLNPKLEADQFEYERQLGLDELSSLDDDPRQKVMIRLKEQFYPEPLGRSTIGSREELEKLTAERAAKLFEEHFNPAETVFGIAGKFDFEQVCHQLEQLFGSKPKREAEEIELKNAGEKYTHIQNEGAQVHIGLMTGTVTPEDPDYYKARAAVSVLSGGMSARLFTEVREKRGLCYAVAARYHGLKRAAGMISYAGTTPKKGQETLDVILEEFDRLKEGIDAEEMQRAKAGLKSSLVMQSESTGSRSAHLVNDYYIRGRVRTLEEIREKIEQLTAESVVEFLRKNEFTDYTIVTIGPVKLSPGASG